jgi:archaellum component FlaC
MTNDLSPITRSDYNGMMEIMNQILTKVDHVETRIDRLDDKITNINNDLRTYIDLRYEQLHYDYKGLYNDKVADHEMRISRLEKHATM